MKNYILILNIVVLLITASSNIFTQVNEDWVNRYNGTGSGEDRGYSVDVDDDGNCYVTGFATGYSDHEIVTKSYDASGNTRWTSNFNSQASGNDGGKKIKYYDGYVYVAGSTATSSNGSDYILIKYNSSNGNSVWSATYNGGGNGQDNINDMAIDNSGYIYVTGRSTSNGNGFDIVTVKYNSSGSQQWVTSYNNSRSNLDDYANAICVDFYGNVYVTGATTESSYTDYVTIKYNSSGTQQWLKKYDNGDGTDIAYSIAVDETGDNPGNVYVTGNSYGNGKDILTVAYDNSDGTELWSQRINGYNNNDDWGVKVKVNSSGEVIVAGTSFTSTTNDFDYYVVKYNSSGSAQWTAKYNGPGSHRDILYDMTFDANGNIYVTGLSRSSTSTSSGDYATLKYDTDGNDIWVIRYNSSYENNDLARSIAVNGSGYVFITGMSENYSDLDYATVQYSQDSDNNNDIKSSASKNIELSQNYPNPFNPVTNISFNIQVNSVVRLDIFDVSGKTVQTLLNRYLSAGNYEVNWDATNYPSGIYFYSIDNGYSKEVKKMILLK